MADATAAASGTDAPSPEGAETPTQRQARLRREKRQKKMTEQGEDRLARIKALNGGVAPPDEVLGGPQAQPQQTPKSTASASVDDDPEEVDISANASGFGTPSARTGGGAGGMPEHIDAAQNPLAAAMQQMQQREQARNQRGEMSDGVGQEDPMVKMMEQMMGLMGGAGSNGAGPGGAGGNASQQDLPPMLKALLGGAAGASAAGQAEAPTPTASAAYVWRVVHAVFALSLAGYIALTSTFNGTQLARGSSVYSDEEGYGFGKRLFLIFVTLELVLQSSRYFLEKGKMQGQGMIAQVVNSGVIPEPWAGYARSAGRYVGIVQTLFADAMVVVFVFGALAWWRGMVIT